MAHIPNADFLICLKNLPIVAVDILLFNNEKNKILLFKRANEPVKGIYFSPGGRINKNETIAEAASRKLLEETGLKIDPNKLIFGGVTEESFDNGIFGKIDTHYIDIIYGLILNNDFQENSIKLDSQHSKYKWHNINDDNLHIYMKNKIKTIIDKIK